MVRRFAEWTWYDRGVGARVVRSLLLPCSWLFARIVARRNARFDAAIPLGTMPTVSIGNLTVGGTGKTPVASWIAARLAARGARPAIVLRGYGDDEWRVHQLLTPAVPVVIDADRVRAMQAARQQQADCAVLDDAFQHRRAARVANIVLISADRFDEAVRLLPAGPYREPLTALQRATAVVVTVKAADAEAVQRVEGAVRSVVPAMPIAVVRLEPGALIRVLPVSENTPPDVQPLEDLGNRAVVLASAIADPASFERQMVAAGVRVVRHVRHPDHHAFTADDVAAIDAAAGPAGIVVCSLKDAVKLAPLWPRARAPLWYVSQTLVVDRGAEVLERECDRVLTARTATGPTVG